MEYADSLWAHLGGDADTDVTTQSEVDAWLEKVLAEADDSNLDVSGVDNEPLSETTWNAQARRAILRRTASGEPDWIEAARRIVNTGAYETVDGMAFDNFAASAVLQVYEAVNDENKAKLGALSLPQAVSITFKMINRNRAVARRTATRRTAKAARDIAVGDQISGPGSGYSPTGTTSGTVSKVDSTTTPGTVYIYFGDHGPPADLIFNHGDPVRISEARRTAGAPTIKGPDAALKAAPKEEQAAYWNFVGQGAADSDAGWYVPLDFNSWRRSYWDDTKGDTTYAPGMPPMASSRRRATGEDPIQQFQQHRHTDDAGNVTYGDDEYEVTGNADTTTGDDDEEELYDDWVHDDDNGYDPMVDDPDRWKWQSGQTGLSVSAAADPRRVTR